MFNPLKLKRGEKLNIYYPFIGRWASYIVADDFCRTSRACLLRAAKKADPKHASYTSFTETELMRLHEAGHIVWVPGDGADIDPAKYVEYVKAVEYRALHNAQARKMKTADPYADERARKLSEAVDSWKAHMQRIYVKAGCDWKNAPITA